MAASIANAIDSFLLDCQARALRPASLSTYARQTRFFAVFAADLAVTQLDQVDTHLLRTYIASMTARGLRAASVRTAGRVLRAWLNWCTAEGLFTPDAAPMRRVRLPKLDRPHPDAFTPDELRALLAAAKKTRTPVRDTAVVLYLLDTGCRIGEFSQWRHGDVDLTAGTVHLRSETTKTHSTRIVFLGENARASLAAYLASQVGDSGARVWLATKGQPLTADGLKRVVQRLGKTAQVQPCGPHKFRRTFATLALRDGMDPKTTAEILGHSVDMLLKVYSSIDDASLAAAHVKHGPVDKLLK